MMTMTSSRRAAHIDQEPETTTDAPVLAVHTGWPDVQNVLNLGSLRTEWEAVLSKDSVATFYQTPLWCVTWYRCYHDEFEPLLLTAMTHGRVVGLAPLARERSSGRIVFAGDSMADYRDFVCEDGWRREVLALFLPHLLAGSPEALLVIGHTQPDSETPALVRQWAAAQRSCRVIIRTHPCQRFRLESPEELRGLYGKKTIRRALNFYRRVGELQCRRVGDLREWNRLKEVFAQQHCLRQALAGRPLSFNDPRKQTFYSRLFESLAPEIHFSGLWLSGRPISFLFSFVHRGVFYYGAQSFDPLEQKHGPGILHILETMKQCQQEGLREIDLTLGSSSFKERLANHCVELPTVYLYGRRHRFWLDMARKAVVERSKPLVRALCRSDEAWDALKTGLAAVRTVWSRVRRQPPRRLLRVASRRLWALLHDTYVGEVFQLRPAHLRRVSVAPLSGEPCEFKQNRLEDFLTLQGADSRHLTTLLRTAIERINEGHTLHTVLVGGRLAHYGWSYRPNGPVWLPETRTPMAVAPGGLSLYDFNTVEAYRGQRLYPANLSHIAAAAFTNDVPVAYIVCEVRNVASRHGIERVGFQRCAVHRQRTLLGFRWSRVHEDRPVAS